MNAAEELMGFQQGMNTIVAYTKSFFGLAGYVDLEGLCAQKKKKKITICPSPADSTVVVCSSAVVL